MMFRLIVWLTFVLHVKGSEKVAGRQGQPQLRRQLQAASCPVQIGISRCPSLLASAAVEPEEGCNCYQFCGDEYVGCCGVDDEDCNVDCGDVNIIPTAGCRLDDVVDPTPEPVCVANLKNGTMLEFEEGDSFGGLLTSPCGDIADWPCFCSGLFEDDKIRCPYCPFYTNEQKFICARSGENITFVDEFDIEQTCSCEYVGNNQIKTVCNPQDVPNQVCALQTNVDQCAELTKDMSFDPDCPCLSFCLGEFSGCCKYGESCAVQCPGGSDPEIDIVSGCQIDPFKQPVEQAPTPPAPEPTLRPEGCMMQANTDNCPILTAVQEPVEGCGPDACYNYCDDTFHSCCELDDMSCSMECQGPTTPVITAGCQLDGPLTCTEFGLPCSEHFECCSNRCYDGKCLRRSSTGFRPKLSGTRGGSAQVGVRNLLGGAENIRGL